MPDDDLDNEQPPPLVREALEHVVKLTSGAATRDDADAVMQWRARSRDHEAAFQEAARLWKSLHGAAADAAADTPAAPLYAPGVSRRSFLRYGATAAGVSAIAASGAFLAFGPSLAELLADYRTGTGERRTVALPDGSTAELNTRSALSLDYSPQERRVELVSGEAVFSVRSDAGRPFVVAAATGTTRAVGTVFAVAHRSSDVAVTCVEGEVEVAAAGARSARLAPGRRVAYADASRGPVDTVDIERELAWRRGLLIFRKERLDRVVEELNRYRPGRIMVLDAGSGGRRVSGTFHIEQADQALRQIEDALNLTVVSLVGGIALIY